MFHLVILCSAKLAVVGASSAQELSTCGMHDGKLLDSPNLYIGHHTYTNTYV
jgi:hypothetical protein